MTEICTYFFAIAKFENFTIANHEDKKISTGWLEVLAMFLCTATLENI